MPESAIIALSMSDGSRLHCKFRRPRMTEDRRSRSDYSGLCEKLPPSYRLSLDKSACKKTEDASQRECWNRLFPCDATS